MHLVVKSVLMLISVTRKFAFEQTEAQKNSSEIPSKESTTWLIVAIKKKVRIQNLVPSPLKTIRSFHHFCNASNTTGKAECSIKKKTAQSMDKSSEFFLL